jgi:hypothetical protein
MDQHITSGVRRPGKHVAHRDKVRPLKHEELDMTACVDTQRWEDDGGAIVTEGWCSPALVADHHHAQAA